MNTYAIFDSRFVDELLNDGEHYQSYKHDDGKDHGRDLAYKHHHKPPVQDDPDTSIVVFDFVQGVSSSHSYRTFDADTTYTIYIRVDSDSAALNTDENAGPGTWDIWSGASALGADDKIVLVGDDPGRDVATQFTLTSVTFVSLPDRGTIQWKGASATFDTVLAVSAFAAGSIVRYTGGSALPARTETGQLWTTGEWTTNPDIGLPFSSVYQRTMADSILVTQGLL